jgi:hypothetical protein
MMHRTGVEDNRFAADQARAQQERAARERLLEVGAAGLDRRPWQPAPVPPSAIDLIHFFLWWSGGAAGAPGEVDDAARRAAALAALQLLGPARAELDQMEAALLFVARGLDLTWAQMAQAVGLNSPQACQQRLDRLLARQERPARGSAS